MDVGEGIPGERRAVLVWAGVPVKLCYQATPGTPALDPSGLFLELGAVPRPVSPSHVYPLSPYMLHAGQQRGHDGEGEHWLFPSQLGVDGPDNVLKEGLLESGKPPPPGGAQRVVLPYTEDAAHRSHKPAQACRVPQEAHCRHTDMTDMGRMSPDSTG